MIWQNKKKTLVVSTCVYYVFIVVIKKELFMPVKTVSSNKFNINNLDEIKTIIKYEATKKVQKYMLKIDQSIYIIDSLEYKKLTTKKQYLNQ